VSSAFIDELTSACPLGRAEVDASGGDVLVVPPEAWLDCAHAAATCGAQLDWLCGVDEGADPTRLPGDPQSGRVRVVASVLRATEGVLMRTEVAEGQVLSSIADIFATADWYQRETAEMLGVMFDPPPVGPLLLPEEFHGHPLRRDFPLTPRLTTPWPGAAQGGRRARTPGVDPSWNT
jgi:NADH:ubiquinone oxidoreductase subunit C